MGEVLRRVVLALDGLQTGVVDILANGVQDSEVLWLDMQHHVLTVLGRREPHCDAARPGTRRSHDGAVRALRHDEQLPQGCHTVTWSKATSAGHALDLGRHNIQVVAPAVLSSGKCHRHAPSGVGGALAYDGADDSSLHNDGALDAEIFGRCHALAAPEAAGYHQGHIVGTHLPFHGTAAQRWVVQPHDKPCKRLLCGWPHDHSSGARQHRRPVVMRHRVQDLDARSHFEAARQVQADLGDHAVEPVSAPILAVAEGDSDPVLCVRAARPHHRAQDALADDNGPAHSKIAGGNDRIPTAEVAGYGSLYVVGIAGNLLRYLLIAAHGEVDEQAPAPRTRRVPRRADDEPGRASRYCPAVGDLDGPGCAYAAAHLVPTHESVPELVWQAVQPVVAEVLALLELHTDAPRGARRPYDTAATALADDHGTADPEVPHSDDGVAALEAADVRGGHISAVVRNGRHIAFPRE
mmetsp:Transcript_52774/g.164041  ORF Transcript_52774/g.164041 Transcript_52774/m.164041 type:complete len:466 (-) Transcript_52774:71-1468(-)